MQLSHYQQTLLDKMTKIQLAQPAEKQALDLAVSQLQSGRKSQMESRIVYEDFKQQLRQLALAGHLSKEGLVLLKQMTQPNFNEDVARSSATWFS